MPVLVRRQAKSTIALRSERVRAIAERMLEALDRSADELSILITDDVFIRTLNGTHRGKDRATDVLAFPLDETPKPRPRRGRSMAARSRTPSLLGDVVISVDTAARQARRRRHSLLDEVRFLLAHGILHLLGYDHQTDRDEAEMNALTRALVDKTGPSSPSRR